MKKHFILSALFLCLLTACGAPAQEENPPPVETDITVGTIYSPEDPLPPGAGWDSEPRSLAEDETPSRFTCRIVDIAEDGSLLLAELADGPYNGTGVFRLENPDTAQVSLDGQLVSASELQDGMTVEITYNGFIQETFPAQLPGVYEINAEATSGTYFDLCGLYLQVLDDLWQKDSGLNDDVTQIALDLSNAPGGLTESEQAALIWRFGELHDVEAFAATFDELSEQGHITAKEDSPLRVWEDGCFFAIQPNESHEGETYSLPTIFFNAEKWRSSLGAYCFHDCFAGWGQTGTWNGYTIGGEMIS